MSNNPALYNAAFSGSSAGMGSRSLTAAAAPFFVQTANACRAFALAIDSALGVLSNITQADCDLLEAICLSYWQNRVPTHQAEADYADIAGPLAEYFVAMRAGLDAAGVPMIGSDSVINQSEIWPDAADTITDVVNLLGGSDPLKLVVGKFSTNKVYGLVDSQVQSSNNDFPAYEWEWPFAGGAAQFCIGPDQNIYNVSTVLNAIMRYTLPARNMVIPRFPIATRGAGANGHTSVFMSQSPRSGWDPMTMIGIGSTGYIYPGEQQYAKTFPGYSNPVAMAYAPAVSAIEAVIDQSGRLWKSTNGEINRFPVPAAGAMNADVRIAGANWPGSNQGIAMDTSQNMWRANYIANAGDLRMLNAAGIAAIVGAGVSNPAPTVILTSTSFRGLQMIFFDYNNNLWFNCYEGQIIGRIPAASLGASGAVVPDIILEGGGAFGDGNADGIIHMRALNGFAPLR